MIYEDALRDCVRDALTSIGGDPALLDKVYAKVWDVLEPSKPRRVIFPNFDLNTPPHEPTTEERAASIALVSYELRASSWPIPEGLP